jgi:hypothetical protein
MSRCGDERRTRDQPRSRRRSTLNSMNERGSQLLEAHMRSLDPAELTAQERLAEAIGQPLARKLLLALRAAN